MTGPSDWASSDWSVILSAWECTDTCSKALSIALNHKENTSIMAVTSAILPKKYANAITQHEQKKKYCPMQHQLVINVNKQKTKQFFISNIVAIVSSTPKKADQN